LCGQAKAAEKGEEYSLIIAHHRYFIARSGASSARRIDEKPTLPFLPRPPHYSVWRVAMGDLDKSQSGAASSAEVRAFAEAASRTPARAPGGGRLIFALDATMSRQPTWDLAQQLQAEMFSAASGCGGLDIQLVYFRGFGECRASRFVRDGAGLSRAMAKISVQGGMTQIGRVLRHIKAEQTEAPVGAFVFIGDAMEEKADELARAAGELGLRGVKGFFFQEGGNSEVAAVFKDLARLTGGRLCCFRHRRARPARRIAQGRRRLCRRRICCARGEGEAGRGRSETAARADEVTSFIGQA
jgi:hypothetical protein